ncbi:hypothetical protein P879_04948 [Paragonimus westermani]|uniref:Sugar phosphate exchanger 3 n=1 Tax=Paragonimus westermani TaxID=34504 RepID=A0A8T0DFN3_9TREM|nr:hypothetical protein P879_04948 [Paragonimus westermani]
MTARFAATRFRATIDRVVVFTLTYLSYAMLHANRKAFGNLKPTIASSWTPVVSNQSDPVLHPREIWSSNCLFISEQDAAVFLGVLDSLFMAAYAVGLYLSGWLGDRLDHRFVLCSGLCGSAMMIFLFGVVVEFTKFYNKYFYAILWIFNGLLQSTIWPSAVAIMNIWFGSFRGVTLGVWSSCASVGNIVGDLVVGSVVPFGYHYGFLVLSTCLFGCALMIFCGLLTPEVDERPNVLPTHPVEPTDGSASGTNINDSSVNLLSQSCSSDKHLPFLRVLLIPDVISCSLAYACIKLVNYALFFWLTFYLTKNFHWSNSDASNFSVWYDVGGILGGVTAGLISDCSAPRSSRHLTNLIFSIAAIPALLGYRFTPAEPLWANGVVMCLAGFFVGGPAVLISTVVVGDICNYPELRGTHTQATVAGIIDGTGSVGAAAGQILIPYLAYRFDWSMIFYCFIVCMILTILCLIPSWFRFNRQAPFTEPIVT